MDQRSLWRKRLELWIEDGWPNHVIIALIVVNAMTIGLETSKEVMAVAGTWLIRFEHFVIVVFVAELLIKLVAQGRRFFSSGWNVFDFLVISIALVPAAGPLAVLRTLRVFRVLRLLSTIPRLRQLTESLIAAIPSIGWISFMLALVFYIFAIIGTEFFGAAFPDWFGSVGDSMYTLFQVMTLESWSMGIARPVMDAFPLAWLYFVPFILLSAFTILNLFIGVIVNTMQALHWEEEEEKRLETAEKAHAEREEMLDLLRQTSKRLERIEKRLGQ